MISSAEIDLIRRDPAIPGLAVVFDRSLQSFQLRWLLQQPLAKLDGALSAQAAFGGLDDTFGDGVAGQPACIACIFLAITSSVFLSSSAGLNITSSVPAAWSTGTWPGGA